MIIVGLQILLLFFVLFGTSEENCYILFTLEDLTLFPLKNIFFENRFNVVQDRYLNFVFIMTKIYETLFLFFLPFYHLHICNFLVTVRQRKLRITPSCHHNKSNENDFIILFTLKDILDVELSPRKS
jgi:hypothetical protein